MRDKFTISTKDNTASHVIHMGLIAALLAGPLQARTVSVPAPAVPAFADTEVSTNVAVCVDYVRMQEVRLNLVLNGCASNCLQVAFGRDADGDGDLGFSETEAVYGYRNGRFFAEGVTAGERIEEVAADSEDSRQLSVRMLLDVRRGLKSFAATDGNGDGVLDGLSPSGHPWLYNPAWNVIRVTRRGPGVPAEWFQCEIRSHHFFIRIR